MAQTSGYSRRFRYAVLVQGDRYATKRVGSAREGVIEAACGRGVLGPGRGPTGEKRVPAVATKGATPIFACVPRSHASRRDKRGELPCVCTRNRATAAKIKRQMGW